MKERILALVHKLRSLFSASPAKLMARGELLKMVREAAPTAFFSTFNAADLREYLAARGTPESDLPISRLSSLLRTVAEEGALEVISKGVGRKLAVYRRAIPRRNALPVPDPPQTADDSPQSAA